MAKQTTAPNASKMRQPKPRAIGAMQVNFMLGIMQGKGYSASRARAVVTALSTVNTFDELSSDEARYLIARLPRISKDKLDAFMADTTSFKEIGFSKYDPRLSTALRKRGK